MMEVGINVLDVSANTPEVIPEPVSESPVPAGELQEDEENMPEELSAASEDLQEEPADETVSGGDLTVSGNVYVENFVDYGPVLEDIHAELQTLKKEEQSIWDKPLEDYTVTEGLLLCLVLMMIALLIGKIFRGGEKYV